MLIQTLKMFCDLVDSQSFTRAAALNSVTQSAVSQQIKKIEARQRKMLIRREKRRILLTSAGEVFYRDAREIVRRYEEMQHRIKALDDVVSGTVRLSSIYSVGMGELASYLKAYLKAYPRVNLRLEYKQAQKIYDDVASSEVDLGIVAHPLPNRDIEAIPFSEDRMVVVCHPSNPLSAQTGVALGDLNRCPLILFTPEASTRQAIDRFFRKHRTHPTVVMEFDHIDTIKDAVEVNLGISILPAPSVEQEVARGTLKALKIEGEHLTRPLGILYRRGRSFSTAAQKLIEVLTKGPGAPVARSGIDDCGDLLEGK